MRIRKRPLAATAFGKPELHESSNGGLHLHVGSKSNSSFQDPRSSLLSPASIIKPDHLFLAGSGYVATNRPLHKQLPDAVSLQRRPSMVLSSGVGSCADGKGLMMKKGEGSPETKNIVMDVQHHEVKHMHMHDNMKGMDMKGCKELGLLGTSGEADKFAEICNKASHGIAGRGFALNEEINEHADPAMVDTSDCPRKVRPLQLILSSDYSPTVPKLPLPLRPTSSSSIMSRMPPPPPCEFERGSPCVMTETPLFASPAAGSLYKQIAAVKSRVEMKLISHEDVSRMGSQNNSDKSPANISENRAEFESCGLLQKSIDGPVSSWQGHRKPRSHVHAVRSFNGAPGVNAVLKTENKPTEPKRKKLKQTKTNVSPCISVQALTPPATGNGELRMQDFRAAPIKNKAHTKKKEKEPLFGSTSAAGVLPIFTRTVSSIVKSPSLVAKRAATTTAHTYDDHTCSVAPAPTSDLGLQLDSMRCRRKDGRQWRCKEQVIKAGAPFCHYHTLKMREKHAASVARKLLKQLQGEGKIKLSYADLIRSCNKTANKRRKLGSSSIDLQDGYRRGCKDEERHQDEEEKVKENDNEAEKQKMLGKQAQLLESLRLRRRWRKKCKPCIRRLHDIHDRAGPAATDGLDYLNPCVADPYKDSPPVRCPSPLPECLLNTDPYEWRSDFP